MSVSIWWSTLGHFEYTGAILLALPGLLGGSQHNIFRTRSLSAGVASEVVVREFFFWLSCKFQNLSAGFASDERRREKQLNACSFDSSYGKLF